MPFPVAPEGQRYGDSGASPPKAADDLMKPADQLLMQTNPAAPANDAPIQHAGLPVRGYTSQPDWKVSHVNRMKLFEEKLLRELDAMAAAVPGGDFDGRWLAIGRTHLEQAFMAINRSVFRPQRIDLEDDDGRD